MSNKSKDQIQWGEVPFIDYLNEVDRLLEERYGITSNDVGLERIASYQEAAATPQDYVSDIGEKHDLTPRNEGKTPAITGLKFPIGALLVTPGVRDTVDTADLLSALHRHHQGDWGNVCPDDAAANESALQHGDRLLSLYQSGATTFWIITEADRSATTVLLPSEY